MLKLKLSALIVLLCVFCLVFTACSKEPEPTPTPEVIEVEEWVDPEELYQQILADKTGENAVYQFVYYISKRDWVKALDWFYLPEGAIFSAEDLENAVLKMSESYPIDYNNVGINVALTSKSTGVQRYKITYWEQMLDVPALTVLHLETVVRDWDNRWMVDCAPFLVQDYRIIVPRDCPTYINNTLLNPSWGTLDEKKQFTHFVIPAIARREVEVRVDSDLQAPHYLRVVPEKRGEIKVVAKLSDNTFFELRDYLMTVLNDVMYSLEIAEPTSEILLSYVDNYSTSLNALASMYDAALSKVKGTPSYNTITVKDILPWEDSRVEAVDKLRLSVRIIYNSNEVSRSGRTANIDKEARVWVVFTKVGDSWRIDSADTNLLKYWN